MRRPRRARAWLGWSVAAAAVAMGGASRAQADVFWTDHGSLMPGAGAIGRAAADGTSAEQSLVAGPSFPFGIAVDTGHLYWANNLTGTIGRANRDGSGAEEDLITGASFPEGVAVDAAHIYWTNSAASARSIGRANLDGTGVEQSLITGASFPEGVAVDGAHIYWANSAAATIGRANLDGSGATQVLISGASTPWGVAVGAGHIYWANLGTGTIGRAKLDGSAVDQRFITGAKSPTGVAVDSSHLYWVNSATATIGRAGLDGTAVEERFVPVAGSRPQGVAVDDTSASASAGTPGAREPAAHCVVPQLRGRTLAQARRLLVGPRCTLGKVVARRRLPHQKRHRLVVGSQRPAAGTVLRQGAPVQVRLTAATAAG